MTDGQAESAATESDIALIEQRIERLAESLERCRKISLGAKIAVTGGAALFALIMLGLVTFDASAFFASLTVMIGAVVLLGSNATTWEQTLVEMQKAEAIRAALIDSTELRVVHDAPPLLQ